MNSVNTIADIVRETAYQLHLYLGFGFLEKVYENALVKLFKSNKDEAWRVN